MMNGSEGVCRSGWEKRVLMGNCFRWLAVQGVWPCKLSSAAATGGDPFMRVDGMTRRLGRSLTEGRQIAMAHTTGLLCRGRRAAAGLAVLARCQRLLRSARRSALGEPWPA
jgi:hypothetical protein